MIKTFLEDRVIIKLRKKNYILKYLKDKNSKIIGPVGIEPTLET